MPVKQRYEGTRWRILHGGYEGVEQVAIDEVQRRIQAFVPYTMRVEEASPRTLADGGHLVLVGTPANNSCLVQLIEMGLLDEPPASQGFSIACVASPWTEGAKVLAIAGGSPAGVLYGVEELCSHLLDGHLLVDHPLKLRESLDAIAPLRVTDRPLVENRGIWTWGYVIYDYRRFIDNMARLRLNMLTIWNDCPPVNARKVIAYAHSRGVQVVMGFHWGWGVENLDPASDEDMERTAAEVRENYLRNYHGLDIDGIYFQTFTETYDTTMSGRRVAALACKWVNRISSDLYAIKPDLLIQFGLHATSIVDDFTDLADLDPRVTITWEDVGAMPFSYEPVTDLRPLGFTKPEGLLDSEGSVQYSKRLVSFRTNREFAMVPKGYTALRWDTEFEHHGPFILGERDAAWVEKRWAERKPRWDRVNALWLRNFHHAARFYREILDCGPERMTLTALVEDGMLECAIEPAVALFAETAWNPRRDDADLLRRALCPYFTEPSRRA